MNSRDTTEVDSREIKAATPPTEETTTPATPAPAPAATPPVSPANDRKDSTSELPMIDLADTLTFVTTIHEKAVETASLNDVAKACNYSSSTTTPFYRRMLAARLFKLLSPQKAELTPTALEYIRPETDDAKQKALLTAINAVPAYVEAIQKYSGKRVNIEFVATGFFNKFKITMPCAIACARVFQASLKTADVISPDGVVTIGKQQADTKPPTEADKNVDSDTLTSTLVLDPKTKRKIEIKAPYTITTKELARIRSWLEFQLIVSDPQE